MVPVTQSKLTQGDNSTKIGGDKCCWRGRSQRGGVLVSLRMREWLETPGESPVVSASSLAGHCWCRKAPEEQNLSSGSDAQGAAEGKGNHPRPDGQDDDQKGQLTWRWAPGHI